ncbi:MAG: hypothetical protein LBJ46_08170 [Planctomycetota bacterium]|jgi:hypothetical protein|nr:hypothetical protein [Planctomycetota bacterium]
MDVIGLSVSEVAVCHEIYGFADIYWRFKDGVITGTETQEAVDLTCRSIRKLLEQIEKSDNLHLIIAAERIMCNADLKHFQSLQQIQPDDFPPGSIMRPLQEGVARMDEVNRKLAFRAENIEIFHRYSSATQMEKIDHDASGLPKDGIRKLLLSHKTRLSNRSTGFDAVGREERSLIQFRKMNIQKAEHLYKAMQREALGIAPKSPKDQ